MASALYHVNPCMKGSSGKRLLLLIAAVGAFIAAAVLWAEDSNTTLLGICAGVGLILLAWVQFGEEFKKR